MRSYHMSSYCFMVTILSASSILKRSRMKIVMLSDEPIVCKLLKKGYFPENIGRI